MAASVTGSKTVTQKVSPAHTASYLTTLLAIALENMTVAQFNDVHEALQKVPHGSEPQVTLGALFA